MSGGFCVIFFPLDNHFKILSTKIMQPLKNNFCPIVCRGPDKIYASRISNNSGPIFIPDKIHQNKHNFKK